MTEALAPRLRRPASTLADHVECYWAGHSAGRDGARELVLPTAAMSLVFSIDDMGAMSKVLTGPRSQPIVLDTSRGFTAIGVKFKIGGGASFAQAPSCELHNQTVRLDDLWGDRAGDLEGQIWQAPTIDEKFGVIERTLLQRINRLEQRHSGVVYALQQIDRTAGNCKVAALADDIGISARRLGQLFAREVGFSPKALNRIRRFEQVLQLIDSTAQVDWTDIALSCGYYDQPHFNHEFRTFCGMDPSGYLRKRLSQTHVQLDG